MARPRRPVAVLGILILAAAILALSACTARPPPSEVPPSTPELASGQVTESGKTLAASCHPASRS